MDTLPSRVRHARGVAGISQRELDRLAGLCQGHTRRIESERGANITVDTARALARVLGVPLGWIVDGGVVPLDRCIRAAVEAARSVTEIT